MISFTLVSRVNLIARPVLLPAFFHLSIPHNRNILIRKGEKKHKSSTKNVRRWLRHIMEDPKNVISTCNEVKGWCYLVAGAKLVSRSF